MDPTVILLVAAGAGLYMWSKLPERRDPLEILHENVLARSGVAKAVSSIKSLKTILPVLPTIPTMSPAISSNLPIAFSNIDTLLNNLPTTSANPTPSSGDKLFAL